MAGGTVIVGLLASSVAIGPLAFHEQSTVPDREIRLGELADVSQLPPPLRARAAVLPLVMLAPDRDQAVVSANRLRERARALMPALRPWLDDQTDSKITLRVALQQGERAGAAGVCMQAARPLAAGSVVSAHDFASSDCGRAAPRAALSYDPRRGAARTVRDLKPGETVAAAPRFALADIAPGQKLYARAEVGPVIVQREVEALQAARVGRRLFVKAADGAVFSVALRDGGQ